MDITQILHDWGLQSERLIDFLSTLITLATIALCAWLSYFLVKKWIGRFILWMVHRTRFRWDSLMFDRTFFSRLGLLVAPNVVLVGLSWIKWEKMYLVERFVGAWIVLAAVMLIMAVLNGLERIYQSYPISKDRPIKVFVQSVMIFFWCAGLIVIVGIFTRESVSTLLAGLTAFAAVLMLVFKDSIMGFVAGIQLGANNMVSIGDWITMADAGADGTVMDINLTTVKVRNWDMTITTIPTYKLVSDSFVNWRGMAESQGRRIKRSIYIDVTSIHYLTPEEIDSLAQSDLLKDYIRDKQAELQAYNAQHENPLDQLRLTNIGAFREYLELWLAHRPDINTQMTHMVRQLQSGPTGLPLEIYCFSAQQEWVRYEQIQSDIFDHVLAIVGQFNLRIFQYSDAPD